MSDQLNSSDIRGDLDIFERGNYDPWWWWLFVFVLFYVWLVDEGVIFFFHLKLLMIKKTNCFYFNVTQYKNVCISLKVHLCDYFVTPTCVRLNFIFDKMIFFCCDSKLIFAFFKPKFQFVLESIKTINLKILFLSPIWLDVSTLLTFVLTHML